MRNKLPIKETSFLYRETGDQRVRHQKEIHMSKLLLTIVSTLAFSSIAFAEGNKSDDDISPVINLMITAKATGMCGVFSQMANFQEATKMPGGDEFIIRFISTEAARLGMTSEKLVGQCPSIVEKYNSTMKSLGN